MGSLVVRNCVVIMGVTYLLQGYLYGAAIEMIPKDLRGALFIGISLFLSIFQFSLGTSITAVSSGLVPKPMQGTLMGMEHSLFAGAGIVGPLAGTYIFPGYGISGLGYSVGAVFFFVFLVWMKMYKPEHSN